MKVVTIGRNEDNDVVIKDTHASRYHLQIIQHDDGHFSLSDFGSTNGTYVNGQKISGEIDLNQNDVIRIGNSTLPWRMYFDPDNEMPFAPELFGAGDDDTNGNETETGGMNPTVTDSKDSYDDISAGMIISLTVSVSMILGGLIVALALRASAFGVLLVIAGVILLIISVLKIVLNNKKNECGKR